MEKNLNVIIMVDMSAGINTRHITTIKDSVSEMLSHIDQCSENKGIHSLIRILIFNDSANWVVGSAEIPEKACNAMEYWKNNISLEAKGVRNTANAIYAVKKALDRDIIGETNYSPVIILVSNGRSCDQKSTKAAIDDIKKVLHGHTKRISLGLPFADHQEMDAWASCGTIQEGIDMCADVCFMGNLFRYNVPFSIYLEDYTELEWICGNLGASIVFEVDKDDYLLHPAWSEWIIVKERKEIDWKVDYGSDIDSFGWDDNDDW